MEPQEIINERNELFESLKSDFKERGKKARIAYAVFFLLVGLLTYIAVCGHLDWLFCIVCSVCMLVVVFHGMYGNSKLIKASNAQDFLANYDKNKMIAKWINIIFIPIVLIVSILFVINMKVKFLDVAPFIIAYLFFSFLGSNATGERDEQRRIRNDIERLRELVQQS